MRAAAAAAVALSLLAGCSDPPAEGTTVQLADGSAVQLSDEGALSGVVVDEAIRPLAGVLVTVLGQGIDSVTDTGGLFLVAELAPGLYTLAANATGYLRTQTTVEVVVGQTAKVRMVLPTDTTPQPFHVTQKFEGFNQAGNSLASQAYELFVNGTAGVPYDSCQCQFYYTVEQPADTHIVEVTWERSVDSPAAESSGYWAIWDEDGGDYQDDSCGNPCLGRIDGFFPADSRRFSIDIWLDSDWVQVNQAFTVFLTLFYNGAAPADWSFVEGDP
jgi:hypothetical protein